MKTMKKLMALALAVVLMLALAVTASAATITINRDSTWDESAPEHRATYTYHKILDATIKSDTNIVYTISDTDSDKEDKADAINDTGVLTATLAADGKYYVTRNEGAADSEILTAIKTLVEENATLFPGTPVTSGDNPVVLTVPSDGYYYIEASNGKDAIVRTIGDVTIYEKNDYPTIDKQQKQADDSDYHDDAEPAQIGTYIDYKVVVHIPADANKQIAVIDKMSDGLEYDDTTGLTVAPDVAYSLLTSEDSGYDADAAWQIKFADSVVAANRDSDITITFRAKVTAAALTDTGKENEVTLNYDNGNYILKDDVDYETYFAGIYKVDPANESANMSGVKFVLKDGDDNAVNVIYDNTNGYYVVDSNSSSNEVETRADGSNYTIKIRGLDNEKSYTLTETETVSGYNLLSTPVNLTLIKDEGSAFTGKAANTYDRVENQSGAVLPSTGGMGTKVLYGIGAVLVIGAGVILVTKKRAEA